MSEIQAIERAGQRPATVDSLVAAFRAIGLRPGMVLLVHSSLSALGWVVGGPVAFILALEEVLGPSGTLVMPTHSGDLSEPSHWVNPPVPESWWPVIRGEMPAFDPVLTPTRGMGAIPETFRNQPGVIRSPHPQTSFAARGPAAPVICGTHALDFSLGEGSPLARLYELEASVLLLGVGHDSNTSLHLAEYRAAYRSKTMVRNGAPVLVNGRRQWLELQDLDLSTDDFPAIGAAYEQETGLMQRGRVAQADCMIMPQRALVDFATQWMRANRA